MKPSGIAEIQSFYKIQLNQIIEDERDFSQVEFYKNENTYSLNPEGEVIKLNLKNNYLESLSGLKSLSRSLTHLNLSGNKLKSIDELSTFTNLIFLDLSTNFIIELDSISNLENLEFLYLDNNQILELPIFQLPKIEILWLYSNNIVNINNLKFLQNLKSINLGNNQIIDISVLKGLKKLKQIYLNNNNIEDISVMDNFKDLIYLDLSENKITDILALKNIAISSDLKLGQNKIFDLTPLYFSLRDNKINFLNAFENPLRYPPFEIVQRGEGSIFSWFSMLFENVDIKIAESKRLKSNKLDIGNMGITDLSMFPELFKLNYLKELIISNEWAEYDEVNNKWLFVESENNRVKNNISNIPSELSKLKNLEKIVIGGDWKNKKGENYNKWRIDDISSVCQLSNLRFLNASNNQIKDISDILKLKNIEIIHLNNNKIIHVPNLDELKNLKEIYLSNNQIDNIDFLLRSTQIETVDLHSNGITNLIPLKELLQKSSIHLKNSSWEKKCISISKNSPNLNPPYEVLNLSKNDFLLYLKQLEYESKLNLKPYNNKEIKIVLVGNSYSGKSTFLNYLKTKRFKKGLPSTHWLVTEELENITIENVELKLRFFDFGGQDYYHDTHKMFFSSDSIYLLLWDENSNLLGKIENERDNSDEEIQVFPLEYWLDSIKIFAKKSLSESERQIEQLLDERDRRINSKVRNRRNGNWLNDLKKSNNIVSKVFDYKNILVIQNKIDIKKGFLNQQKLVNEYSNIYDFVNVSLLNKRGIKQFHECYIDILKRSLNYKRPLLTTWGIIKDNLNEVFTDVFIIDINGFKKRINDYLLIKLKEEYNKSDKEISSIIFKDDDEIILFANFLNEIGLVIFSSKNQNTNNTIVVNQNRFLKVVSKILNIAKEYKGEVDEKDLINIKFYKETIQILISHNIIFENIAKKNYVAPLFLPEKPDFLVNLLADVKTPFRRFKFDGFIPKSIILSVFSKIINIENVSNEDFYFWKNGLIFKNKNGYKVLLKFDIGLDLGFAYIDIFNFEKNSSDSFVKDVVKIINDIILNECNEYRELVTLDGKYFADCKKLIFNYESGINYIKAYSYESKNKTIKHINIYKYNKFMDDKLKKPNKKLFISYSKQDEAVVNRFIKHLSSLQSDGLIESWYCTELKAGEDWDQKIKEKLSAADIVCFMISPNFMSTPYIHKYEVKSIFSRYEKGDDVKIVPIILDFINWSRKYNFTSESGEELSWSLDKFTALPFTGKEVADFENENQAWYIVENALRVIINEDVNSEVDEDDIVRKFPPKIQEVYERIMSRK